MPHPATAASPALPESPPGDVTAGLDWATTDHAVAVVNSKGAITEQFAVDATGAGLRELVRPTPPRRRRGGGHRTTSARDTILDQDNSPPDLRETHTT